MAMDTIIAIATPPGRGGGNRRGGREPGAAQAGGPKQHQPVVRD